MVKICLCLTAPTLKRDLEILQKNRKYIDVAELRVDCLEPDERLLIRDFPQQAEVPVILTVRRERDGGQFIGGEGARIGLLSKGLAFADVDRRKNFAYVDMEEDIQVPSLEDAARTFGTRIIRSFHDFSGVSPNLIERILKLRRVKDEIIKAAVMPKSLADVLTVYRASKALAGIEKILLCMGPFGRITRILAGKMGSELTYAVAGNEPDCPDGGLGQLTVQELSELYHLHKIRDSTRIFGVTGFPLAATSSPVFFNTIFNLEGTDAVYVPIPADTIQSAIDLAEDFGIDGLSVTVPHKETVLPFLSFQSPMVKTVGACNTLVRKLGLLWTPLETLTIKNNYFRSFKLPDFEDLY